MSHHPLDKARARFIKVNVRLSQETNRAVSGIEMSELQNKAVALIAQNESILATQSAADRSARFLESALSLYFALGGDEETARATLLTSMIADLPKVDAAVADVVLELAVVSHLSDIDMVQAAYNRLDAELDEPSRPR